MHIRVLGPFEVVVDGVALPLGSPQQRAVLAMLARRPNEVVATDALVDALWPREAPASAVQVVRTYVSRLRRVLAGADAAARIVGRPPGYLLEVAPDVVDARRFERLVRCGHDEAAAGRADAAAATFRRALGLWRGDVLADLDWLAPAQAAAGHLEQLRLAALEGRIAADLALGRHAEVAPELEALTGEHPFRERLWAQRMVALYRAGRQADALAAYRQLRATMVRELGLEPGPELQELERQVLRQSAGLRLAPPAPPAPPLPAMLAHPAHARPLVGRAREWAVLAEALDEARAGHFGAVFLSGPPGIGKTALAGRFVRHARDGGATVLLGRADEGSPSPFHALREAVAHWWRHGGADGRAGRLGPEDVATLAQVAPELAAPPGPAAAGAPPDAPGVPGVPDAPGDDQARRRLFEAVRRWVEEVAAGPAAPLVLVLDDLQWADPASLLAVHHLLRHPPAAGALLVATHRDVGGGAGHPLSDLLAGARSDAHVRRLALAGLDDDGVAALVADAARAHAGGDDDGRDAGDGTAAAVDPALAAELARVTGGNPLFVRETVRDLAERGAIAATSGRWASAEPLGRVGAAAGVKEVIDQRLRRLPGATAATLREASVLGEHIDVALLGRVTEQPVADVVAAIEPAIDAQLVRREPGPDGGYAFAHALVRDALLDDVAPTRRAHAHWRAGLALMARGAAGREPPLGEIAHHLTAGVDVGEPAVAVEANLRAGDRALAALAFEDAAARYESAIELLDRSDHPDLDAAFDAAFGLGQVGSAVNDRDRQRAGFLRAAAVARAQGRGDRLAHAAIGVVDYLNAASEVPRPGDRSDDRALAQELLDEALARVGDAPTTDRLLLLTHQATRAMTLGRPAEARAFADAAVATAGGLDAPAAVPFARVAQLWSRLGRPCDASFRDAPAGALAFAAPPRHRTSLLVFVVPMLPIVPLQLGERAALDATRARVAADPDTRGATHLAAYVRMWETAVALCEGRLDEAEALATALLDTSRGTVWDGIGALQAISVAVERGDPGSASFLGAYLAEVPDSIVARAILAAVHAADGDAGDAARQVAHLRARHDWCDLGWSAPLVLRHLAEAAARLGDAELAADVLAVLAPFGGQMLVSFHGATVEAAADRAIGQALGVLGRHDDAVARLRAARALESGFGADALAARTGFWLARAHLARGAAGDREAARRLLDEVAASTERLGLHGLRRDVVALAGGQAAP